MWQPCIFVYRNPEQYQVCPNALDTILKDAFEILETSPDNRGHQRPWYAR
jgi:hypothetical protein